MYGLVKYFLHSSKSSTKIILPERVTQVLQRSADVISVACPQQQNGYDCGIFVCAFTEFLVSTLRRVAAGASDARSLETAFDAACKGMLENVSQSGMSRRRQSIHDSLFAAETKEMLRKVSASWMIFLDLESVTDNFLQFGFHQGVHRYCHHSSLVLRKSHCYNLLSVESFPRQLQRGQSLPLIATRKEESEWCESLKSCHVPVLLLGSRICICTNKPVKFHAHLKQSIHTNNVHPSCTRQKLGHDLKIRIWINQLVIFT